MKKGWYGIICFMMTYSLFAQQEIIQSKGNIFTFTLDNGLTILVHPKKDTSIVSAQLWYNVGSKHEKDGQRGITHFIEHLIFKGTEEMLSESDIVAVTNKLSGWCNAFTSYDYTCYVFDIPVANWDKVLPIMADCMQHCSFKQDCINSEMKAVIQELKMNKDNYMRSMWFEMITNIFESHPYHYPIIGYKQDLWSVTRETLKDFYKKYYTPDNAAMVIVGDIDPEQVYQKVAQAFNHIPAGSGWNKEKFYSNDDMKTKSITLHRKVNQSACSMVYVVPGFNTGTHFDLEVLSYALGGGKGSRLHKLLVDELQLVSKVSSFVLDLAEYSLLWIDFVPKADKDIERVGQCIQEQLDDIAQGGLALKKLQELKGLQACISAVIAKMLKIRHML